MGRILALLTLLAAVTGCRQASATTAAGPIANSAAYVPRVMVAGDSISAGVGAAGISCYSEPLLNSATGAGLRYVPVGSQPFQVGALVSLGPCHMGFPGAAIRNTGSDQSLATLVYPYVASYQPDLVILQAGTNDIALLGDSSATVLASMSAELDTVWKAMGNSHGMIVRLTLLQRYDDVGFNATVQAVNAGLAAVVASKSYASHVIIADIYGAAPYPADHAANDGVHPNDAGYTSMAATMLSVVEVALKQARYVPLN